MIMELLLYEINLAVSHHSLEPYIEQEGKLIPEKEKMKKFIGDIKSFSQTVWEWEKGST